MTIRFSIPLIIPSLKNQKGTRRGQTGMYDKTPIKAFKRDFPMLVPSWYRELAMGSRKQFLEVTIRLYHPDWRRDADCEAIYDALQVAGVVSNDRWVRIKHIYATEVDPVNPRAEIEITELSC